MATITITSALALIAAAAANELSDTTNFYEKVPGVGAWGGSCKCPDGQQFQVGDHDDACGSLACQGGAAGHCERAIVETRRGMRVRCNGTSAVNVYEKVPSVGLWGGICTCPDGQQYQVGDRGDACGSLACEGGVAGQCEQTIVESRRGKSVRCNAPLYFPPKCMDPSTFDRSLHLPPFLEVFSEGCSTLLACQSDEYVMNCTRSSGQCPDGWTYRNQTTTTTMDSVEECCRCGHESVEPRMCAESCPCWNRITAPVSALRGRERTCKDEIHDTTMTNTDFFLNVGKDVLRRFPQCTCSQ